MLHVAKFVCYSSLEELKEISAFLVHFFFISSWPFFVLQSSQRLGFYEVKFSFEEDFVRDLALGEWFPPTYLVACMSQV